MAALDLTGQKYNRLTALYPTGERTKHGRNVIWMCLCDCGKYTKVDTGQLRGGWIKSCGCLVVEHARNLNKTHGGRNDRLYLIWMDMRRRCRDPKDKGYKNYGERGISVCAEWDNSYEAFRDWAINAGYDSCAERGKCTIDRIDVNGNYAPNNCRWVSAVTQNNNRRNNRYISHNGKTMTYAEWEREIGYPKGLISKRIASGWTFERALTEKPHSNGRVRK